MDTEACGEFLEMMPEGKPAQVSLPNRKNMQRFLDQFTYEVAKQRTWGAG